MNRFDYDVAIIGGGSGGYAAARTAADAGLKTVVIEGGKEVGGLCILRGCMPTKALLYASDVLHLARTAGTWGLRVPSAGFDFASVMARKNALIREFAGDRVRQLTSGRFEFLRATARFVDPNTVRLAREKPSRAAHFVVSTGSTVSPPPLPQLAFVGYLTSDDALILERLPESMIVLGGGAVGVEFAQFFARLDVKVTLVQRGEHLLKDFDTDAGDVLLQAFRREGIEAHTGTRLLDAGRDAAGKWVALSWAERRSGFPPERFCSLWDEFRRPGRSIWKLRA